MKYIYLIVLLFGLNAFAAQNGYVKSVKAYVYADKNLKTPIGFIRQGKKILVGEVKRNRGQVLPIIVAGKLAYIKVEDLVLKDYVAQKDVEGKGHTEHINLERDEEVDNFFENNYFVFHYNQFTAGAQWEEMVSALGDDGSSPMTQLTFMFQHRPIIYNYFFGVGMGYYRAQTENFTFSAVSAEALLGYNLGRPFDKVFLDATLGLSFSSGAKIEVSTSEKIHEGNLYGYDVGLQARLFPQDEYGAVLGMSYKIVNFANFSDINLPGFESDYNLRSLSGFNIYAGIHTKF